MNGAEDPLGRAPGDVTLVLSADTDHHLVRVSLHWWPARRTDHPVTADGRLSPADAFALARSLITSAATALETTAQDYAAGDCATCSNVRLVTKHHKNGHNESVVCPDCRPAFDAAPNNPPTIPGPWARREARVLRREIPEESK